jgi:hypothetical protein
MLVSVEKPKDDIIKIINVVKYSNAEANTKKHEFLPS